MADDAKGPDDAKLDPKKGGLDANAKPFDCGSPTLDPYHGPHGIRTQPGYVPPAPIPPQMPQPNKAAQATRTQHLPQQQQQQQRMQRQQPYPPQQPQFDGHSEAERDRRMYPKPYPQMGHQQHMARHPQQGYAPMAAPHQKYPPNYQYTMNQNVAPHDPHYRPPPQHRPHPQMAGRYPNQYGQNAPPHGMAQYRAPNGSQQGQPAAAQPTQSPPLQQNGVGTPSKNKPSSAGPSAAESANPALKGNAANPSNGGTAVSNVAAAGTAGGALKAPPNGMAPATGGSGVVPNGKVQFKTYTTQKNAIAVGQTLAYKHPSRSHYGQPDAKHRDPKFTNPPSLEQTQRWELLESAKRWLPGEGTLITWKNHRYLIGPPIHMGMNGHIHYCYKYPVPRHLRTRGGTGTGHGDRDRGSDRHCQPQPTHHSSSTNNNNKKNKGDAPQSPPRGRDGKKNNGDDEEADEMGISEIDINSPCVETLAAKIVPNTPAFAREIVILRALQECENVTELYDVLESERTLISILELAQADVYNFFVGRGSTRHGWNLEKPAVREHFSKMVISNVVQGLDQMHKAQYLHCDLKSLNILLYIYVTDHSNRRGGVYIKAKLTDFGHSSHGTTRIAEKLFSNGMARVGTAGHVAPELFKEGTKCTEKIDIWSLGIVMFSMLVPGRLLFSEYTNLEALKRGYDRLNKMNPWSRDRPSWWTDFERLSPESRDLILWMTRYDAAARPTCEQILKHPWFLIGKQGHREHYRAKLKYVDMLCSSSIAQE